MDTDRFASVEPQTESSVSYEHTLISHFLYTLSIVIFLIAIMFVFLFSVLIQQSSTLTVFAAISLVLTYYGYRLEVRFIEAGERGIKIGYWFRLNKFIPWEEISEVFIVRRFGIECHLNGVPGIAYFRPAGFFGLQMSETLISTIIRRGNLVKVENPEAPRIKSLIFRAPHVQVVTTYRRKDGEGLINRV